MRHAMDDRADTSPATGTLLARPVTRRRVLQGGMALGAGLLAASCGSSTPTRSPQASALAQAATSAAPTALPALTTPAPVLSANLLRTALGNLLPGGTVILPGGGTAAYADLATTAAAFAAADAASPDPVTDPIASLGFALACADRSGQTGRIDLSGVLPKLGIPIVRLEVPKLPGSELTDTLAAATPSGLVLRPGAALLAAAVLPDGRLVLGVADPARTVAGHPRLELALLAPATAGPLLEAAGASLDPSGAITVPGAAPVALATVDAPLATRLATAAGVLFVDLAPLQPAGAKPALTADPVVPAPDPSVVSGLSRVSQAKDGRVLALDTTEKAVGRARYRPWRPDWEWVSDLTEIQDYTIRELADALGLSLSTFVDINGFSETLFIRTFEDVANGIIGSDEFAVQVVFSNFTLADWKRVLAQWSNVSASLAAGALPDGFPFLWSSADGVLAFARARGAAVIRGPALLGSADLPAPLVNGGFAEADLRRLIEFTVRCPLLRYRDTIPTWTGVSEIGQSLLWGSPAQRWIYDQLGTEIVDQVYLWARRTAPKVKLVFTEDHLLEAPIDDAARQIMDVILGYLEHFKAARIPVDLVESENNLSIYEAPTKAQMIVTLRSLQSLGYGIAPGETMVVVSPNDLGHGGLTGHVPNVAQAQANLYRDVLEAYLEVGAPFGLGGITDKYSWFNYVGEPQTKATLFDANYQPKPAYFAVRDVLKAELRKRGWTG